MKKEFYLYVNGQKVKVSEEIYKVYWREREHEKYLEQVDRKNHLLFFSSLDQDGHFAENIIDESVDVETIVLLSKLDSKKYISVELPMDDMDLTSAESKATYKQIQNYVLEKFGFKVSTLYIAQVKKKHGLEVREHYNMSKNEKQKIPKCPIEKEEVILDALKHFKMIKDDF